VQRLEQQVVQAAVGPLGGGVPGQAPLGRHPGLLEQRDQRLDVRRPRPAGALASGERVEESRAASSGV
jgi:hypothetical protein